MTDWYVHVKTEDGVLTALFSHTPASNPLIDRPEAFEFPVETPNEYATVTKQDVDGIEDDESYWVFDCHDKLGTYFSAVPDVLPREYSQPTYFVGVPKRYVHTVTTNQSTPSTPTTELDELKRQYYRGEILREKVVEQLPTEH